MLVGPDLPWHPYLSYMSLFPASPTNIQEHLIIKSCHGWQVISIGPYHHNKITSGDNVVFQHYKYQCVRFLLSLHGDNDKQAEKRLKDCLRKMKELSMQKIRHQYSEIISLNDDELAVLMLYDGCFLIRLLLMQRLTLSAADSAVIDERRSARNNTRFWNLLLLFRGTDSGKLTMTINDTENLPGPLLGKDWMWKLVSYDLLKLENQIPFFVLQELFKILVTDNGKKETKSLEILALNLFREIKPGEPRINIVAGGEYYHLLHLFHSSLLPPNRVQHASAENTGNDDQPAINPANQWISIGRCWGSSSPREHPHAAGDNTSNNDQLTLNAANQRISLGRCWGSSSPKEHQNASVENTGNNDQPALNPANRGISVGRFWGSSSPKEHQHASVENTGNDNQPASNHAPSSGRGSCCDHWISMGTCWGCPPPKEQSGVTPDRWIIPTTTDLRTAGVKFKENRRRDVNFMDITFKNGTMAIPQLRVLDHTSLLFRNLVAFEQLCPGIDTRITAYVVVMDCLIDTAQDVRVLQQKGVIDNRLNTDEAVVEVFNNLKTNVPYVLDCNVYEDVFVQVNRYHKNKCRGRIASLKRDYFKNPWTVISLAAAMFLLGLTFIQAFFAVYAYFKPPKGR